MDDHNEDDLRARREITNSKQHEEFSRNLCILAMVMMVMMVMVTLVMLVMIGLVFRMMEIVMMMMVVMGNGDGVDSGRNKHQQTY